MAARVRRDIWKLGQTWHPTILWYAKAIRRMQQRPISDRTSWRYLAAIHGFEPGRWREVGHDVTGQALPPQGERESVWAPCPHRNWYFLPWHRAYLASYESIVGAAVVELGGPADWGLPYWNVTDRTPNASRLPRAFSERRLPDGTPNPLFVAHRYGDRVDGDALRRGLEKALRDPDFIGADGSAAGTTTGFGGPPSDTGRSAGAPGLCESQPHNTVHSIIGGRGPGGIRGMMTDTLTAGLDPIFWIHHSNIDRLWEVWLRRDPVNRNPAEPRWREGPADRRFTMPDARGQLRQSRPADLLDIAAPHLNYAYEDVSDPIGGGVRGSLRGMVASVLEGVGDDQPTRVTELIGASEATVRVEVAGATAAVRMDPAAGERMVQSAMLESTGEPDRIFLNLENIVSDNDAAVLAVYVGLPPDADPAAHPDHLAGEISLFGISQATDADAGHGGSGITEVLEITEIVDRLNLRGELDPARLGVRIVPSANVLPGEVIPIGRISLFRNAAA